VSWIDPIKSTQVEGATYSELADTTPSASIINELQF
jgi:hypothetical protein